MSSPLGFLLPRLIEKEVERIKITSGTIFLFFSLIVGSVIAYYSIHILIIAFIGLLIGILLTPTLDYMQRRLSLPRGISSGIVILLMTAIFGLIAFSIYYLVSGQVETLAERMPEIQRRIHSFGDKALAQYPWIENQWDEVQSKVPVQQGFSKLFSGIKNGIAAIGGGIFILIIGIYTAYYSSEYANALYKSIPAKFRVKTIAVLKEMTTVLRGWFKAQLADMMIVGALTSVGLWICGVEYWAIFGLLTAVMGIIPYVGIFFVVGAASLVTLASAPDKLPWVLGVFFITQQLEGHLIIPLLMKEKVNLPVVPLLIFMLFMGHFLGVVGIFLSPPLLAIIKTIYDRVYLPYIELKR